MAGSELRNSKAGEQRTFTNLSNFGPTTHTGGEICQTGKLLNLQSATKSFHHPLSLVCADSLTTFESSTSSVVYLHLPNLLSIIRVSNTNSSIIRHPHSSIKPQTPLNIFKLCSIPRLRLPRRSEEDGSISKEFHKRKTQWQRHGGFK